jgi:hypothetical protein
MAVILGIAGAMSGCAGGQEATPEALTKAKQLWTTASIADYDLEWTVAGGQNNHYYVTVRGGEVLKVEALLPDGTRMTRKIADSRYYSVDGLFLTIANELAQLKTDHPFDQPKGTKILMRFKPDPTLGYPQWYRRDVMGTSLSIAIDVVNLVPQSPNAR